MARKLRFRPNLGARLLSSKRRLRISVNLPAEPAFFWDAVRDGIQEEAKLFAYSGVEIEFRSYASLNLSEEAALDTALKAEVNAIILGTAGWPKLRSLVRRASCSRVPVLSVGADSPMPGCLSSISMDSFISSSVAGELLSRMMDESGELAMVAEDLTKNEQAEIYDAFRCGAQSGLPQMQMLPLMKDQGDESKLYEKCRKLIFNHPDLSGLYVSTTNIEPVIKALQESKRQINVIAASLSPSVINYLESGHLFAAFYQRPCCQGRLAFRLMHDFLVEARRPPEITRLAPHLITRGSLNFFLQQFDSKWSPAQVQHGHEAELQPQNSGEHSGDRAQLCWSSGQNGFL